MTAWRARTARCPSSRLRARLIRDDDGQRGGRRRGRATLRVRGEGPHGACRKRRRHRARPNRRERLLADQPRHHRPIARAAVRHRSNLAASLARSVDEVARLASARPRPAHAARACSRAPPARSRPGAVRLMHGGRGASTVVGYARVKKKDKKPEPGSAPSRARVTNAKAATNANGASCDDADGENAAGESRARAPRNYDATFPSQTNRAHAEPTRSPIRWPTPDGGRRAPASRARASTSARDGAIPRSSRARQIKRRKEFSCRRRNETSGGTRRHPPRRAPATRCRGARATRSRPCRSTTPRSASGRTSIWWKPPKRPTGDVPDAATGVDAPEKHIPDGLAPTRGPNATRATSSTRWSSKRRRFLRKNHFDAPFKKRATTARRSPRSRSPRAIAAACGRLSRGGPKPNERRRSPSSRFAGRSAARGSRGGKDPSARPAAALEDLRPPREVAVRARCAARAVARGAARRQGRAESRALEARRIPSGRRRRRGVSGPEKDANHDYERGARAEKYGEDEPSKARRESLESLESRLESLDPPPRDIRRRRVPRRGVSSCTARGRRERRTPPGDENTRASRRRPRRTRRRRADIYLFPPR